MTVQPDKPKKDLPNWLVVPLFLGISLICLGWSMPSLYPTESQWTDADAKQHTDLAIKAHAAHHAAANALSNNLHTVKEDAAKAQYYREQFDLSAAKLKDVREKGSKYGRWMMIAGGALTMSGVVTALILRRE